MTRLLSLFGLMRVSEHERHIKAMIDATEAHYKPRFEQAVADLEKQAGEIATLREANSSLAIGNALLSRENAALRPDALAMRRKRQRDRELKAAKAAGKVQP